MRHFLLLTFVLAYTAMWAADNDTVVINKPTKVTVITNDSLQKIIVKGQESDSSYVYRNTIQMVDSNYVSQTTIDRDDWSLIPKVAVTKNDSCKGTLVEGTAHLGIGFQSVANASAGTNFKLLRSTDYFFVPLQFDVHLRGHGRRSRNILSLGIGLNWRTYCMKGDMRLMKNEEGRVVLSSYPEGSKPGHSQVNIFSLSFPLLYQHRFGHGWGFKVGPVFNWNTYGRLKTVYDKDGGEYTFKEKSIGQRRWTIDCLLVLKNPVIPLYVRYSPMNVLKGTDVEFQSLSFGLCF